MSKEDEPRRMKSTIKAAYDNRVANETLRGLSAYLGRGRHMESLSIEVLQAEYDRAYPQWLANPNDEAAAALADDLAAEFALRNAQPDMSASNEAMRSFADDLEAQFRKLSESDWEAVAKSFIDELQADTRSKQ